MANKKPNHIEKLKEELYSKRKGGTRYRVGSLRKDDGSDAEVPKEWKSKPPTPPPKKTTNSMFKKLFIFSVIFLIAAIGFAGYKFLVGSNTVSSENVHVEIDGPRFFAGGEEATVQVTVTNENAVPIEFATITLSYPKGSDGELEGEFIRSRKDIEQLGSGKQHIQEFPVVLFGGQGVEKIIRASLEYRVRGSNAIFVKEETFPVSISSAPIELAIEAPQNMSSNQAMTFNISALVNAFDTSETLRVRVAYPPGFEFSSATPEPSAEDNVWDFSNLESGQERRIRISGILYGQEGEEKVFKISGGTANEQNPQEIDVVLNSKVQTIALSEPFIQTRITANGQSGNSVVLTPGQDLTVSVDWENTLGERIDNVEIRAALSGNLLDEDSIDVTDGFYNSLDKTVVWDRDTNRDFDSIEPNERGTVSFTMQPTSSVSGGEILQNPLFRIVATTAGLIIGAGGASEEVTNIEETEVRIATDLKVNGRTAHFGGPFPNAGPIPPVAEKETTYTLIFSLSNTTSTVTGARLQTTLPRYVEYLGVVSPATEAVTYNESTRQLRWDIGTVAKGTGITGTTRELAVQVAAIPSLSHVGQQIHLTGQVNITGTDSYTDKEVGGQRSALTTFLLNDTSIDRAGFVVSP